MPRQMQAGEPVNLFGFGASTDLTIADKVAGSAINAGDVVVVDPSDTSGNTVATTTTADSVRVYGVALNNATTGARVRVAIPPSVVTANVAAAVAVGDRLGTSTTAGVLAATIAAGSGVGVALTAAAAGKATVYLKYS